MLPEKGITPHPGEMLSEEYLKPMGITQAAFGKHIGLDVASLSALIHGKRSVTPTLAIKIGLALGMTPDFWLRLQGMHDLTKTREALRSRRRLPKIKPMKEALEAEAEK
jgi:addiction module HigA family antidote